MDFDVELKKMKAIRGKDRKVAITVMFPPSIINEIDEQAAKHRLSRGDFLIACFLRTNGIGDDMVIVSEKPKPKNELERLTRYNMKYPSSPKTMCQAITDGSYIEEE